jgi:hypothetical protein
VTDPWAWLERDRTQPGLDAGRHPVSVLVVSDVADEVRAALGEQSVQPVEIVVAGSLNAAAQRAVGEWFCCAQPWTRTGSA